MRITRIYFNCIVAACAFSGSISPWIAAAEVFWDAAGSSDWHTAANWSGTAVPGGQADVFIANGGTAVISAGAANTSSITIGGTARGGLLLDSRMLTSGSITLGEGAWFSAKGGMGSRDATITTGGVLATSSQVTLLFNRAKIQASADNDDFFKNINLLDISGAGLGGAVSAFVFDSGTYSVGISSNILFAQNGGTTKRAFEKTGDGTLTLGGSTINLSGNHLYVNGGTLALSGSLGFGNIYLGEKADATGALILTGTASGATNAVIVGSSGSGFLEIAGGSLIHGAGAGNAQIGGDAAANTGTGVAIVSGTGYWKITSGMFVGDYGVGTLEIRDSGSVFNGAGTQLARSSATATGRVIISGSGSWEGAAVGNLGQNGTGYFEIKDSGRAKFGSAITNGVNIGNNATGSGTLVVSDNAHFQTTGTLAIGNAGRGTLILNGGTAQAAAFVMAASANGTGVLEIGGVANGSLILHDNTLADINAGAGSGGATIRFTHAVTSTFSNLLVGKFRVEHTGSGTTAMNLNAVHTGVTDLKAGVLQITVPENLGNTALSGSATLALDNAADTFAFTGTQLSGGFTGNIRPQNGTRYAIEDTKAAILANATLQLGAGGTALVTTATSIHGLDFGAGIFELSLGGDGEVEHLLTVENKFIAGSGTLKLAGASSIAPAIDFGANVIDQNNNALDGDTVLLIKIDNLVGAQQVAIDTGIAGSGVTHIYKDAANNDAVTAYYDVMAITGTNGVGEAGLHLAYGLRELNIFDGKELALDTSTVDAASARILSTPITGNGSVRITGDSYVTIASAASTYTGVTIIDAGAELRGGAEDILARSAGLVANGTFNTGAYSQSVKSLAGSGAVIIGSAQTFSITAAAGHIYTGTVSGDGNFSKSGTGEQTIVDIAIAGLSTVSNGKLTVTGAITGSAATAATGTLYATTIGGGIYNRSNALIALLSGASENSGVLVVGTIAGTITNNAAARITADAITASVINSGSIGAVNISGNLTNRSGGVVTTATLAGITENQAGATLDVTTLVVALANSGLARIAATQTSGDITNSGELHLASISSDLVNNAAGIVHLAIAPNTGFHFNGRVVNAGIIDLRGAGAIAINNLASGGADPGSFLLNINLQTGESDKLTITGEATGAHKLTFTNPEGATPSNPGDININVVTIASGDATFTADPIQVGMNTYELAPSDTADGAWNIVMGGKLSSAADAILSTAGIIGTDWHYSLDTIHKRMGELRVSLPDIATKRVGVWMRGNVYHLDGDPELGGSAFKQDTWNISAGIDTAFVGKKGALLVGAVTSFGRTDRTYENIGNGNTDDIGLGLYATFLHKDEWYIDFVAKADAYDNELTARSPNGLITHAAYSTDAQGLSLEIGQLVRKGRLWIEPSIQASVAWITSDNYMTDNGLAVAIEDSTAWQYAARIRAGAVFGRWITRVMIGVVKSDTDGGSVFADGRSYTPNFDGFRYEAGAGLSYRTSDTSELYLDYEYNKSDAYKRPWAVGLGYRAAW